MTSIRWVSTSNQNVTQQPEQLNNQHTQKCNQRIQEAVTCNHSHMFMLQTPCNKAATLFLPTCAHHHCSELYPKIFYSLNHHTPTNLHQGRALIFYSPTTKATQLSDPKHHHNQTVALFQYF